MRLDSAGQITGVPDHLEQEFDQLLAYNKLERSEENLEKAANVAETSFKLRNKKKTGKLMKIDETKFATLDRNMTVEQIFREMRELCSKGDFHALYKKVARGVNLPVCGLPTLVSGLKVRHATFFTLFCFFRYALKCEL